MAIFCKVTQNPNFLKNCKGGTKGNFSKIAQKVAFVGKESQRYGNFCKVTLNPHFLKKCKGGPKKNFSKITKK